MIGDGKGPNKVPGEWLPSIAAVAPSCMRPEAHEAQKWIVSSCKVLLIGLILVKCSLKARRGVRVAYIFHSLQRRSIISPR